MNSSDEIDRVVQNLENLKSDEDQMSDSSLSMDSKLLQNSSCASSIHLARYDSYNKKPKKHVVDREKLLKYSKILIRAVRRQISYNRYKDQLKKQMNMYR